MRELFIRNSPKFIIFITGTVFFLIYSWLSIQFYDLKTAFIDAPYMLINMINNEGFFIPLGRYTLCLTEILPIIGIKLGLGINSLAILYAVNYVLFLYFMFLACLKWIRNYWYAINAILLTTVGVKYLFYVMPSEGLLGVAILNFILGYCLENKDRIIGWKQVIIILLGVFLIVFSHPFVALIALAILLILFLCEKPFKIYLNAVSFLQVILLLLFIIKNFVLEKSPYEESTFRDLANHYKDFFHLQSHFYFFKWLIIDYYYLIILFFTSVIFFILKKRIRELWLYVIALVFIISLLNLRDYDDSLQFYVEHYVLVISYFLIFFFSYLLNQFSFNKNRLRYITTILILVALQRLYVFYDTHEHFEKRIEWQTSLIEKLTPNGSNRVLVCQEILNDKPELIAEKLSYETMYLSLTKYNKLVAVSTTWSENIKPIDLNTYNEIYGTGLSIHQFNKKYFDFSENVEYVYFCEDL